MGFGAAGGAKNFVELKDTPSTFTASKFPKVKTTADGLEWKDADHYTFTKIFDGGVDTPSSGYVIPITKIPYISLADSQENMKDFFAVAVGEYIYVGGGDNYSSADNFTNKFYRYNIFTREWTRLANLPVAAEFSPGAADHYNGKIYAVTQECASGNYTRVFVYDIATNTWAVYEAGYHQMGQNIVAACSDGLYYIGRSNVPDSRHYLFNYTTHESSLLTAFPVLPNDNMIGGKIGDDFYVTRPNSPFQTYKYNKGTTNWDDQSQNAPNGFSVNGCHIEAHDKFYGCTLDYKLYRYTTAGGWVKIIDPWTYAWHRIVQFTAWEHCFMLFDTAPENRLVWLWNTSGIWELASQAVVEGDVIVVTTPNSPVCVSVGGQFLLMTIELLSTFALEAATWDFKVSKDYDYRYVKIWHGER